MCLSLPKKLFHEVFVYKSLQAGRAIAALLVVLFHLGGAISVDKYFGIKEFSIPFSFGNAGVEFFFVLSGFIIMTAHRNDIFKPHILPSYIKKRLIRIYPTYWVIFIPIFILAAGMPSLRHTVPYDIPILLKSLLLVPQDKDVVGGTGAPVLIVAWTLQYEMFFYFCFALLIYNKWLSLVAGITLCCFYLYAKFTNCLLFPLSFLFDDFIFLFLMGMVISLLHKSKNLVVNRPIFYAVIGGLMFLLIALDTVAQFNLFIDWAVILYGLASCLIIFGLVQAEDEGYIIGGHSWMQTLGDSSYALYLIHFPLISLLCKFSLTIQLNKLGILGALIAYVAILCASLVGAVMFHLWIEKPIATYFRKKIFIKPIKDYC